MEIVRCEKGHFYDADVYDSCPQCLEESRSGGMSPYGATEPIGATQPVEPIGATQPVGGMGNGGGLPPTMPVTQPGFTATDFVSGSGMGNGNVNGGGNGNMGMQSYEPTMPVSPNGVAGFNPVTGWLVCVEGPDKGTDYRIHSGYNYIGRAQSMDICIQSDNHISNQNAAVIGYDDVERKFSFGPAGGHNTVRVNGKMVINAVELADHDELMVGTTKLMFVPLCGERFDWNEET